MVSAFLNTANKAKRDVVRLFSLTFVTGGLLFASLAANASTLISSTEYIDYEFPDSVQEQCYEKNNCPQIKVKYLKTNQDWLNDIVNKRVNNIAINSKMSESPVSNATDDKAAKLAIDDFAQSQMIDLPDEVQWSYSLIVTPEYLGHVKLGQGEDLELFEISSYVFTGGAHGMPSREYLVFDPASKQQIILEDMLKPNQQARFNALAYDAYQSWVQSMDEDVKSYEQSWPFTLSHNITLTDKGVDIRYQPYAIGPYAYGMPVLTIAYDNLTGILKPRFLPSI